MVLTVCLAADIDYFVRSLRGRPGQTDASLIGNSDSTRPVDQTTSPSATLGSPNPSLSVLETVTHLRTVNFSDPFLRYRSGDSCDSVQISVPEGSQDVERNAGSPRSIFLSTRQRFVYGELHFHSPHQADMSLPRDEGSTDIIVEIGSQELVRHLEHGEHDDLVNGQIGPCTLAVPPLSPSLSDASLVPGAPAHGADSAELSDLVGEINPATRFPSPDFSSHSPPLGTAAHREFRVVRRRHVPVLDLVALHVYLRVMKCAWCTEVRRCLNTGSVITILRHPASINACILGLYITLSGLTPSQVVLCVLCCAVDPSHFCHLHPIVLVCNLRPRLTQRSYI